MNSYTIELEDALAGALLLRAAQQELTLSELISLLLHQTIQARNGVADLPASQPMTLVEAVNFAIDKARLLPASREFKVEDLFTEADWDRVPSHRAFGRVFRQRLEAVSPAVASFQRKSPANKAIYLRSST